MPKYTKDYIYELHNSARMRKYPKLKNDLMVIERKKTPLTEKDKEKIKIADNLINK